MALRLTPVTRQRIAEIDRIAMERPKDCGEFVRQLGENPVTYFEGRDWSGVDFRETDVSNISFARARMNGVLLNREQVAVVRATGPAVLTLRESAEAKAAYAAAVVEIERAQEAGEVGLWLNSKNLSYLKRIPAEISGFKTLKLLNLSGTEVEDISVLENLPRLEMVVLSDTKVSDVSPLWNSDSLETLDLNYTDVSDLQPLAGLFNLKRLYLSGTNVENLDPMKGLWQLKVLKIDFTKVFELSGLRKLNRLIEGGAWISDIPAVQSNPKLYAISVTGVPEKRAEKLLQFLNDEANTATFF